MKNPVLYRHQNLLWSRSGVVWATWRLEGLPAGYTSEDLAQNIFITHKALFQNLLGEGLLQGLCATSDPVDIVNAMLDGVDIRNAPEWARECTLTLDALEDINLGERTFWLSIPIAASNWKARLEGAWFATQAWLQETVALPKTPPSPAQIQHALSVATAIGKKIPGPFQARPATVAEQLWIAAHSQHRGLFIDEPAPSGEAHDNVVQRTAAPSPFLDEGGQSDLDPKSLKRFNPIGRRYLKVQSSQSPEPSYQVLQALAAGPKAGWRAPEVNWVSCVDEFAVDVDWAIRFASTPAEQVRRRNKKAERELNDQLDQQEGTMAITGGASDLGEVAHTLAQFVASLNHSEHEVETQGTVIFAVGAADPETAKDAAAYLASQYKQSEFLIEAPLGGQEELWWAMQPGTPTGTLVRDYAQITTGREFASGLPVVSYHLGDKTGIRIGNTTTTAQPSPLLLNLVAAVKADQAANFGIVCELGGGKSTLLKIVCGSLVDRGAQLFVLDRTAKREYAVFAASIHGRKVIHADVLEPTYSLDPLRILGVAKGATVVQSLFAAMFDLDPVSELGTYLSALLAEDYLSAHQIHHLGDLLEHLKQTANSDPEANSLLRLLKLYADKGLGRCLFDADLPGVDAAADVIVITTNGLTLPDKDELVNPEDFKRLALESRFGNAMYAMLTGLAKEICFRDETRFALALLDETHHITASKAGERQLRDFLRDGRKHAAGVGLASHDPSDFGSEKNRELIKIRIQMRQTSRPLAINGLNWLGLTTSDGPTESMIKLVTEHLSPVGPDGIVPTHRRGEGLMRDIRGHYGRFQATLPLREDRALASMSTPEVVT